VPGPLPERPPAVPPSPLRVQQPSATGD
jgi:hypothetical protein